MTELAVKASDQLIGLKVRNNAVNFETGANTPGTAVTTWVDGFIDNDRTGQMGATRGTSSGVSVGISYLYTPAMSDILIVNGDEYTITAIIPVNDSGILHYWQVAGSR
jgi:hypothetical protein